MKERTQRPQGAGIGTRRIRALIAATLTCGISACSDPGDPGGDATSDGGLDADAADVLVSDALPDVDAADVGIEADASEPDGAPDAQPDSALPDVAEADAPDGPDTPDALPDGPTGSNICGDGWRDPVNEECDDGVDPVSGADRACTTSCTVIDRLASNDPSGRERRLGAGRHPAAGNGQGHAAVMVELVGDAGDEAQVVIQTFSHVGVRLGTAARPDVALDADPVVAALPSGEFALAYADFVADDDGLGIALVRVSNDASSAVIGDHANFTTDFSQRAPDILWTGTELVVGWEDESTIPRRICTRRFNEQLSPVGAQSCTTDQLPVSRVSLGTMQGQLVRAWRADDDLTSTFRVRMPGGIWDSEAVPSPAFDETIALAELDAATILAVYSDGLGVMRAAMIDASGTDLGEAVVLNVGSVPRFRPALSATADGVYLAWREPAIPPDQGGAWDPAFDELWLQLLSWDGAMLDASAEPIALPRVPWHQQGDQARPALAAVPYWPSGAVFAAWDDLTSTSYDSQAEHGDVVLELIPTPILRTPLAM